MYVHGHCTASVGSAYFTTIIIVLTGVNELSCNNWSITIVTPCTSQGSGQYLSPPKAVVAMSQVTPDYTILIPIFKSRKRLAPTVCTFWQALASRFTFTEPGAVKIAHLDHWSCSVLTDNGFVHIWKFSHFHETVY